PASLYFYAYVSQKIPDTDFRLGFNANLNRSSYYNLINSALNKTLSGTYSGQVAIGKYKLKKYDFYIGIGPEYNTSQSDLQKQINNNGWGINSTFRINWYLPGKLQIGANGTYLYQQKTQSFGQNFDRLLINTTLTKSFLKGDNLKMVLSGNDLLNQNTGFSRRATSNMITQNSYTTIKRYAMFSVIYDLSQMGGVQPKK
ncbi:MAG: TonB-dependent receptor, partial [Daejeonella sp.]